MIHGLVVLFLSLGCFGHGIDTSFGHLEWVHDSDCHDPSTSLSPLDSSRPFVGDDADEVKQHLREARSSEREDDSYGHEGPSEGQGRSSMGLYVKPDRSVAALDLTDRSRVTARQEQV